MEFIESAPLRKLAYLTSITFDEYKAYCNSSDKKITEKKESYDKMLNYCKEMLMFNGSIVRKYEKKDIGRTYGKGACWSLSSKVRSFLFGDNTTDLDMKNAQPTILLWLLKQYNLPHKELEFYCKNRDYILSKGKKDVIKKSYIICITSNKETTSRDKAIIAFDKEMKDSINKLITIRDFNYITETINDKENKYGSTISAILNTYENKILQKVIEFCQSKNIDICALIFDGLLVYGNHYDNTEFIRELENFINNEFIGLNMSFNFKKQETNIIIPDDFTYEPSITNNEIIITCDTDACKAIIQLYPHWVCCNDELYVYDNDTGLWSSSTTIHLKIIMKFEEQLYIHIKDKYGYKKTDKSYGKELSYMKRLPELIKTRCIDNDWLNKIQYSSLGKILFNNGYYDFYNTCFNYKSENGFNNPEIYFAYKLNWDFTEYTDEELEYVSSIKQRLFYDPLGKEQGDFMALNIARGFAGDMMKRIVMGLGSSNCGKSILTTAVSLSCGEYVGAFDASNLAFRNTNNDSAQNLRWAKLLRFKRIIFSNEMKSTVELNGTTIKQLSSGGDKVIGRGHGQNEEEFILHFLSICMANDLPFIKPYDDAISNRLRIVSYNKVFVDEPSNEFELKKDENIINEILTFQFQRCFVGLLIGEYLNWLNNGKPDIEPAEVIQSKNIWVQQDKSPIETFLNEFEITNNINDFVLSEDIQTWINTNKLGITMKKFSVEMKRYSVLKKLDNVDRIVKKMAGKSKNIWVGIKSIDALENEE